MDLCDGFFTQKVAGVTIDTIKPKIRALTLPKGISNITLIYLHLFVKNFVDFHDDASFIN